jgi:hypothetical protein
MRPSAPLFAIVAAGHVAAQDVISIIFSTLREHLDQVFQSFSPNASNASSYFCGSLVATNLPVSSQTASITSCPIPTDVDIGISSVAVSLPSNCTSGIFCNSTARGIASALTVSSFLSLVSVEPSDSSVAADASFYVQAGASTGSSASDETATVTSVDGAPSSADIASIPFRSGRLV